MSWNRVGEYCVTNGDWTVAKYFVKKETIYLLWREKEIVAHCSSFNEAVEHYNEIINKENPFWL
jgi:hypothetical protein